LTETENILRTEFIRIAAITQLSNVRENTRLTLFTITVNYTKTFTDNYGYFLETSMKVMRQQYNAS